MTKEQALKNAKLLIQELIELSDDAYEALVTKKPIVAFYQEQIADILLNRAGCEGEASRSEGGISRTFTNELIPTELKVALLKYGQVKAVRF